MKTPSSFADLVGMTLKQWYGLDEMEQIEAIWYKAKKIAGHKDDTHTYNIYEIEGLFVEEQIHTEWNVRRRFCASTSPDLFLLSK